MHKRAILAGMGLCCLLTVCCSSLFAQPAAAEPPAFPNIAKAIEALGDDEFMIRQRASKFLWHTGQPALVALEKATNHSDPEVRMRATVLVRNLRLGITPDSPPGLQALVAQFYEGDRNTRLRVINDLRQQAAWTTLFGLLKLETDPTNRQQFFNALQADIQRLAPQMIATNDWSMLEQCLEVGKTSEAGRAQFVAFAVLRDKLPAELKLAEEELAKRPTDHTQALLVAAMLRAQGNNAKALEIAASVKAPAPLFLQGLCREQHDWQQLLGFYNEKSTLPRAELFRLGQRVTILRLAGPPAAAEKELAELFAAAPTDDIWYAGKVALINDRPTEAAKLFETNGLLPMAFELLVQRQQHAEALKLAGVTDETEFNDAWLSKLTGDKAVRTSRTVDRFAYAVNVAAELRLIGKDKQFEQLRDLLHSLALADDSRGNAWLQLARLERLPGRQAQLLDLYGRAADRNLSGVLTALFTSKKYQKAQIWWDTLDGDGRWEKPTDRLRAVAVALLPQAFAKHVDVDWPAVAKFATAKGNDLANLGSHRGRIHVLLAEAWAARGDKLQAEQHFQAACLADPASAEAYGDWLFTNERFPDAATQYGRVVAENQGNALAWYLQGTALVRAGKEAEGKKLQRTADLMTLDGTSRYQLALAIHERNLKDESREQWTLLQRTGNPEDQTVTIANQYLGNLVAEKDPLAAAEHWEQLRFHILKPTTNLTEQSGYLEIALSLHRARARGLLAKGDKEDCLKVLALCEQLDPGEIKVVEEFVPLLRKAGMNAEADKLFENNYQIYSNLVKQYPESANFHNQTAWVAAICVRRLDEALVLAERAVKLAPLSPSYADTLAEVHFARGDRERALVWARKAAALEPDGKFYEERLQSFSKRELPTKP